MKRGEPARAALMALVCALASAAGASEATVSLNGARVRYDDARWQAREAPGRIDFTPLGERGRSMDAVELRAVDAGATCTELALQAFEVGAYDTSGLAPTPVTVGGIAGERFEAHTGCRNATPKGVVICIQSGGSAYLLQAVNPGCTGRNPFSGIDPLGEIADGIDLSPAGR